MVDFNALGIDCLKIDIGACNGMKVSQPCATIRKGVNFGVQWLQRFIAENQICQLRILAYESHLLKKQKRLLSTGGIIAVEFDKAAKSLHWHKTLRF